MDRLEPDAADVVAEVALNAHYTDTTVEVIDPAARNLLTTEQSRGRLMAAANSTEAAVTCTPSKVRAPWPSA
ncbi:hypothetical protein CDO52_26965 [Nocardiopsis gilva YIM 90087]|uniref:Uncharacterized protein n=1 Tax=Nocardiopsis gilva YIM 90087 TaxID=1235441 RepID=A0A223SCW1_9ACTN|nr:hypothetical protein [Nocardiopsis gilva]ASU85950.1 hypothetical protein CDO52_26965 [Nocardiopsis gilva YIM 90087]